MILNYFKNKNVWICSFIISYFVLVIPQLQKLFVGDEVDFVRTAEGIATTGLPIYVGAGNTTKLGLWHPTLYANLLAASFKLFGLHEWSARMISVIFTLLTLVIVYLLARHLITSNFSQVLAVLIFLFNPLVIQGSLLIDIDNSTLMFFIALFVYAYLKLDRSQLKNLLALGILFALSLWSKISTPPMLLLGIFIFHTLNGEHKKGLRESAIIGVIGSLIFLATWFLYCNILKLPFWLPFLRNIGYINTGAGITHFLLTHLWGFKNILFWATPFFLFLLFVVFIARASLYYEYKKAVGFDFLVIVGLLIFFEYIIVGSYQTQDFPKYFVPMMPLFSVVFAGYVIMRVNDFTGKDVHTVVLVSIIIIVYSLLLLGDPLLIDRVIFNTLFLQQIVEETALVSMLYVLPLVISYMIFRVFKVKNAFILSLIVPLLLCSVYIDVLQVKADYATGYFYGESGMKDTIDYLRPQINACEVVIAREDVAYYLGVKEFYRLPENPEELSKLIENKDVRYIVISKGGYFTTLAYAEVFESIESKYKLEKEFGDFKIYRG